MASEHKEHLQRRLADGWYALHTCDDCKREFNSPGEDNTAKGLSPEQTAKLVYATCCDFFGPGHEEHSILIIAKALKQTRAEVLATVLAKMDGPKMSHADLYRAIQKLQPAAKELEEYVKNLPLSEIARIKGMPGVAKLGKTYDRPDFHAMEDE